MSQWISESLYHQILDNIPIACVDIAIVFNGKILLVKRKDSPAKGEWWLPGGRVQKGEKMQDTAKRKAKEEVGIDCNVGPIIHTSETIFPDGPSKIPVHSINSCFFVYPVSTDFKVKLDEVHHAGFMWVKKIPKQVHSYVLKCLLSAGLNQ